MRRVLLLWRATLNASLGRCPKCMRQSFLAALVAWALVIVLQFVVQEAAFTAIGAVAAVGLTALWIAHLVTYAARLIAVPDEPGEDRMIAAKIMSRRESIPAFARTLGIIALATVLPAKVLFASGNCDCSQCSSTQYCCPTANGYCGCFPMPCP